MSSLLNDEFKNNKSPPVQNCVLKFYDCGHRQTTTNAEANLSWVQSRRKTLSVFFKLRVHRSEVIDKLFRSHFMIQLGGTLLYTSANQ